MKFTVWGATPATRLPCAQARTSINGVVTGRISLEHKGSYPVRCLATGLTAAIKLHASTMLTSRARMHEVRLASVHHACLPLCMPNSVDTSKQAPLVLACSNM